MISGSAGTVTTRRRAGPARRREGGRPCPGRPGAARRRGAGPGAALRLIIQVMIGTRASLARRQCSGPGPARRGRPGGGTAVDS
jgi:hypothetical protein